MNIANKRFAHDLIPSPGTPGEGQGGGFSRIALNHPQDFLPQTPTPALPRNTGRGRRNLVAIVTGILLAVMLAGCAARENLPAYPWSGSAGAIAVLSHRAQSIKTVSAQCQLTLTRADGQSVRLDGAMAMKPPDSVRLRAWKMGQAVFDLTITNGQTWVETPSDRDARARVLPASASAGKMARAWALLSGAFFTGDDLHVIDRGGPRFMLWRTIEGSRVECEVDRATLTPRVYSMIDPTGRRRLELIEDHYKEIGGIAWPTRMTAHSDQGTVVVEMSDIELNIDLPPGAFRPPARAQRLAE